jgi:hypothetical protein
MTTRKLTHKLRQPVRDRLVKQARQIRLIEAKVSQEQSQAVKHDALLLLSKIARRLASEA